MAKPKNPAAAHGVDEKHENPGIASDRADAPNAGGDATHGKSDMVPAEGEKAPAKSIVPSKYAGKYKNGGSDELAKFINDHCTVGENKEFSFDKFFDLAAKNGIEEAHIKPFEDAIAAKAPGAHGRARMTLRNRLDAKVRKAGHIIGHDDKKHPITLPERAARPPRPAKAEEQKESAAA
jgi:hypothetical protein